jgi:hypothetical protein
MSENCGCCEGLEPLTPLSTANRPGLGALAYRVGTHATFLTTMKARLSAGEYRSLAGLTTRTAGDPAIAMLDAWATVADVLTFYQERIANEGYLRTATERRSILDLVRLIDYVPRPGVAASGYLAFTLENGYTLQIPVGTRAQSLPGPGELPQAFETAEKFEASAEWNTLAPRRSRPQSLKPPASSQESETARIYIKGLAPNLDRNSRILIDYGLEQAFFKVSMVEPDPAADRTLVTLISMPITSQLVSDPPQEFGVAARELARRNLDNVLALVSRTMTILEAVRTRAEENGWTSLESSIHRMVRDLEHKSERWMLTAESPSKKLEDLLKPLSVAPSEQPANALRLPQSLKQSFVSSPASVPDALTRLVRTLRPELDEKLYQAWAQTGTRPSTVRVYALNTASPFGKSAPLRTTIEKNGTTTVEYRDWGFTRSTPGVVESFRIIVGVDRQTYTDDNDPPELGIRLIVETEAGDRDEEERELPLDDYELIFDLEETAQRVRVNIDVEDVEGGKRYTAVWNFLNRQTVVTIGDQVFKVEGPNTNAHEGGPIPEGGETVNAETTPPSAVEIEIEATYPNGGKQISASGKMQRRSSEPTER